MVPPAEQVGEFQVDLLDTELLDRRSQFRNSGKNRTTSGWTLSRGRNIGKPLVRDLQYIL
jgi:hypothetical protein